MSAIEKSPLVAGTLRVLDCSGVADGAAAAIVVRAQDALRYTDRPLYIKALIEPRHTLAQDREDRNIGQIHRHKLSLHLRKCPMLRATCLSVA